MDEGEKRRLFKDKEQSMQMFDPFEPKCLGWLSCSTIAEQHKDHCVNHIDVTFDTTYGVGYVSAYLIEKDVNHLTHSIFCTRPGDISLRSIQCRGDATVIAIGIKKGKAYTFKSDLRIGRSTKIVINLKPASKADVAHLFKLN